MRILEAAGKHSDVPNQIAKCIAEHIEIYGIGESGSQLIPIDGEDRNLADGSSYFVENGKTIRSDTAIIWKNVQIKKIDVSKALESLNNVEG